MTDQPYPKVLVTAAGGDLGQAIIKCLRLMKDRPVSIFGCDADPDSIGTVYVHKFFNVPLAEDENYLNSIKSICDNYQIDSVIPASDAEIFKLSQAAFRGYFNQNPVVISQPYEWLNIYRDKLKSYQSLKGVVDIAQFADGADAHAVHQFIVNSKFPCIVKSRFSSGSKAIKMVHDRTGLYESLRNIPQPLIQEYIDEAHGEFSIGAFSCDNFTTAVAFKRKLGPVGTSWYADNTDQDAEVLAYAYKIIEASGLAGSCNIQVRKSSNGVKLLEINPRFSSLVAARAACGFRDLEWSLNLSLGRKIDKPGAPYKPIKFRRFFHEMIDFGSGYSLVQDWLPDADRLDSNIY